ncbi:MAG: TonB-dependent receptor, partial [Prevotella sp.]|nr:TonB-dependent receptor [Prevotella sp.]
DIAYATAYPTGSSPTGSEEVSSSVGAFAAANFVWMNRYFVDGSYRISGSSKFGENQRYAPFWSVGLGYNLHNEAFAKDLKWLNTFRLRGSYGYTGSVKFSAWQAVTTYTYNSVYAYYTGVGALPIGMSNPDLKWQATKKLNIGLTSSFFDNRLDINLDVYNEKTDNMLIDLSLPPSSGSTAVKSNLGSQTSNGIEFSIWGKIIKTKDWEWNLSLNGLHSKTTINDISEALKRKNEENAQNNSSVAPLIQFREGESPTAIYAVRSAGVDPASGKEIFIRKDGEYTYTYDANDQVAVGDRNPDWQGSISSLLKYKQFSLSANLSYRFGGDMYNTTRVQKIENINPRYNCDERAFTERWKQPGDLVPYLDISTTGGTSYVYSDRFVEKDNELWLSNIFLQYDVPMSVLSSLHLQKLYVGIGMEDLFRLTAAKYERGTSYPYSRSINMSVSVTF